MSDSRKHRKHWFTAAELAALDLPGLPTHKSNIIRLAEREGWQHPQTEGRLWRRRKGRGGGFEYHRNVLPTLPHLCLLARYDRDRLKAVLHALLADMERR